MFKKFVKWILIIIVAILLYSIIFTGRKVIILSNLDKAIIDLKNTKDNIYVKTTKKENSTSDSLKETFIKGEIRKDILQSTNTAPTIIKMTEIMYPKEKKMYIEAGEDKLLSIIQNTNNISNRDNIINAINYDNIRDNNLFEKIGLAINTSVKTVKIDGINCYELSGTNSPIFYENYNENVVGISLYLEKDTGLPIKLVEKVEENGTEKECIIEYEVKFDCVTDDDLAEPDASQYKLQ